VEKAIFAPLIAKYPKAKPLAVALVEAAAKQGASVREFEIAFELVKNAYLNPVERCKPSIAQIEGEMKAALESL